MGEYLPGVLGEIAEIIGEGPALAIAREKGGGRVYFPADPQPDHWLVELIGSAKARALCAAFAVTPGGSREGQRGAYLELPLGPTGTQAETRRAIGRLLREGHSHDKIAREARVSRRTVQRQRAAGRHRDPDDRQPDLFETKMKS